MVSLKFADEHNQVAYLQKSNDKSGPVFHQIVDFLNTTHIRYALTMSPTIFVSQIKQFWNSVESITLEQGDIHESVEALRATVDGVIIDVTESSLRRLLQLDDLNGIITLPNSEIFQHIASMGYDTSEQKVTLKKGCFCPHWRFFIHTLLHCLSPKKTSYEQFGSTMAYPLICLATDRTFNFSKFIFNNMKGNIQSQYKFLMYPRFVQAVLNEFQLQPHNKIYEPSCLKPKVFQNMCKPSYLWNGEVHPLFPQMLAKIQGEDAIIPVVSHHTPTIVVPQIQHTPAVTHTYERRHKQPTPSMTTLHVAEPYGLGTSSGGSRPISSPTREEPESMPYDAPLPTGNTVESVEGSVTLTELMELCTKLTKQVHTLEKDLAQTKEQHATELNHLKSEIQKLQNEVQNLKKQRHVQVVVSSPSLPHDDLSAGSSSGLGISSKQGRKSDAEIEGRKLDLDNMVIDTGFTTENVLGNTLPISSEVEQHVTTDSIISTVSENVTTDVPLVTTAEEDAARRRSVKGKAIVIDSEPEQTRKISKKEQAQIDFDARLAEQFEAAEIEHKKKQKEDEVAGFMEAQRLDKLEAVMAQPISVVPPIIMHEKPSMFSYVPTEEEIEHMINHDPVVKKKAIELIANKTLTEEHRTAQLADFIQMKNQQALDEIIGKVKKGQKKHRQPTKAQIIHEMKVFCCHAGNWKMTNFKRMSHDQIEGIYYRAKRQDSSFKPIDFEEVERFKQSKRKALTTEDQVTKRVKVSKEKESQSEKCAEDLQSAIIIVEEEEDFYPDPLQTKHSIVDWEVYKAKTFASTWKIIRLGGESSSFIQFEDLLKACNRDDLDTLWKLVNERFKADTLKDMKEMQLWVDLRRLYEPDLNDKYWKFDASDLNTTWTYYDKCEVHHVSTTDRVDVFMFAEKDYPLRAKTLSAMLKSKLRVYADNEKVRALIQKIHDQYARADKVLKSTR